MTSRNISADFGVTKQDVERYKKQIAVYKVKKGELLAREKQQNDRITTKGILLMLVYIIIIVCIGMAEAANGGFPVVTCLLLYAPPLLVGIGLHVKAGELLASVLLPGFFLYLLMYHHTYLDPKTVDERLPRDKYLEKELDGRMTALIDTVNAQNGACGKPWVLPESNDWRALDEYF